MKNFKTQITKFIAFVLVATALMGCDDEAPILNFEAGFTYTAIENTEGVVTFLNTSSSTATNFEWDFGDETSSNEINPTKIYTVEGDYNVTLTAKNEAGAVATFSDVVTIDFMNVELPPFDSGLLVNGDFQDGAEPWTIGVGTDPIPTATDADGNIFYSVDVTAAGNPFDVNMSQMLEITQGTTYTLTFDAWSNVNRSVIAGIGLSDGDFSNTTEAVGITTTRQTYTITLTATNFGAPNARVLFDSGAEIGIVNIDNVSLVEGGSTFDSGLLTNGDFEDGAAPWTIGVGTNPVPTATENDNTFYSVDVTAAGNPFDVNMSQMLEITQDATYTLTFDAWSNVNRNIVAGIGLSDGDFSNTSETVAISTTPQSYSLTLTATGFGAANARVLFDSGAEVGIVNIDNVSLVQN